jgi:hypothetical protein
MTLETAITMLGITATVSVVSDDALAGEIDAEQQEYGRMHPGAPQKERIVPAPQIHGHFKVRPISALLELARGTALSDDPEIFAFARRWSILRYLGVFDLHPLGYLRLDTGALEFIGANQRRVISEELGIGFGIVVAKRWCRTRQPTVGTITAIDVDKALNGGQVHNLQRNGSRQPDYLLAYSDPVHASQTTYDLLETKGTVNRSNAKKQLGRAVTQLAGLTVAGKPMTGLAASTVSTVNGISIMAVDPEERPMTWEASNEALERSRLNEVRRRQDVSHLDVEPEEFFAAATNVDNASLAEFSGQMGAADRWLPRRRSRSGSTSRSNDSAQREFGAGTFVGSEQVISVPGSGTQVRVFQGVEKHVADGLRALDGAAVVQAQRAFTIDELDGAQAEASRSGGGGQTTATATAINSDGSVLEISIC